MENINSSVMNNDLLIFDDPFEYFIWNEFITASSFETIKESIHYLKWNKAISEEYLKDNSTFDSTKYVVRDFEETKHAFDVLYSEKFINTINSIFRTHATHLSSIVFLRMNKGFFNYTHSDENSFGELVRLILYITPPDDYKGGELVLHCENEKDLEHTVLKFPSNTLFGFRMCEKSYHSVKKVTSGSRICLSITYS